MIDAPARRIIGPALDRVGRRLDAVGVRAGWLTAAAWVVGVGACVAAAVGAWPEALVAWLVNRSLDGLDGPVARARGATARGAFADLAADFSIYGGFVVGIAIDRPAARLACTCLLAGCYVAGTTYVGLSSLVERRLLGGVAEGGETILAFAAVCVAPSHATGILWVFAGAVGLTALLRVIAGLTAPPANAPDLDQRTPSQAGDHRG